MKSSNIKHQAKKNQKREEEEEEEESLQYNLAYIDHT